MQSTLEGNHKLYKRLSYDIGQRKDSQTIGVSRMPKMNSV